MYCYLLGTQVNFCKSRQTNEYNSTKSFDHFVDNFFAFYGQLLKFAKATCFSPYYGQVINLNDRRPDKITAMYVFDIINLFIL